MIPQLTKPVQGWKQPELSAITINNEVAEMTTETLAKLKQRQSLPMVMEVGMIWRKRDYKKSIWLFCWFFRDERTNIHIESLPIRVIGQKPNKIDQAVDAIKSANAYEVKDIMLEEEKGGDCIYTFTSNKLIECGKEQGLREVIEAYLNKGK